MKAQLKMMMLLVCACLAVSVVAHGDTNWNLQAVDANGVKTWAGSYPVSFQGVVLFESEWFLDSTANYNEIPWDMGGQWQVFVQGVGTDHAGTALYLAQNYGNTWRNNPDFSYTNEEWNDRLADVANATVGSLITVTAPNISFYGGKSNCNEGHDNSPSMHFSISVDDANYGLPTPEEITLADLYVDPASAQYNASYPMFDQTRLSGAEYYQGCLVNVTSLCLDDPADWDQSGDWDARLITAHDADGRTISLRLPRGSELDLGDAPTGWFDVLGVVNQESGSKEDGRFGYEVMVLEVPEPATISLLTLGAVALFRRRK